MKNDSLRSIVFQHQMPYPPERIWRALTEAPLIAEWLYENDFVDEAEPIAVAAVDGYRKRGNGLAFNAVRARNTLARIFQRQGRFDEAERTFREALRVRAEQLSEDHLYTAYVMENLAGLLKKQGRTAEAAELSRRVAEIHEAKLGARTSTPTR